jgi:hypothetical protein
MENQPIHQHEGDKVPKKFISARPFHHGLAVVIEIFEGDAQNRYYAIDKMGYCDWTDFEADSLGDFVNGYAIIKHGNEYGVLNTCNDYMVPAIYDKIDSFSNGYAKVMYKNKWRIINPFGECELKWNGRGNKYWQ